MFKNFVFLSVIALIFVASPALASHIDPNVSHGNGNPLLITQAWGLTQAETVTVPIGATITDESGYSIVCTFFHGCSDITMTDHYRDARIETARQLIEAGRLQFFPQFITYWARFVE